MSMSEPIPDDKILRKKNPIIVYLLHIITFNFYTIVWLPYLYETLNKIIQKQLVNVDKLKKFILSILITYFSIFIILQLSLSTGISRTHLLDPILYVIFFMGFVLAILWILGILFSFCYINYKISISKGSSFHPILEIFISLILFFFYFTVIIYTQYRLNSLINMSVKDGNFIITKNENKKEIKSYIEKYKNYIILLVPLLIIILFIIGKDCTNMIGSMKSIRTIGNDIKPITNDFMILYSNQEYEELYDKYINKDSHEKDEFISKLKSLRESIGNITNFEEFRLYQGGYAIFINYILETDKLKKIRADFSFGIDQYTRVFDQSQPPIFDLEDEIFSQYFTYIYLDTIIVYNIKNKIHNNSMNRE